MAISVIHRCGCPAWGAGRCVTPGYPRLITQRPSGRRRRASTSSASSIRGSWADAGGGERVKATQDVEVPPRRVVQPGELVVDGSLGPFAAIEPVTQHELDRSLLDPPKIIYPVPVATAPVLADALEHRQRGVQGGVLRAGPVQAAVEAPVTQLLPEQEVDHADQLGLVGAEVGRVVQGHAVDAGVTVPAARRGVQPAVRTLLPGEDELDGLPGEVVVRAQPEVAQLQQRVVAAGPLRPVEAEAPVPVLTSSGQQRGPVALLGDAPLQTGVGPVQQVAGGLELDRHIAGQQPAGRPRIGSSGHHAGEALTGRLLAETVGQLEDAGADQVPVAFGGQVCALPGSELGRARDERGAQPGPSAAARSRLWAAASITWPGSRRSSCAAWRYAWGVGL